MMKRLLIFLLLAGQAQGAITITSCGAAQDSTSSTSWSTGLPFSAGVNAGSLGVLCMAVDNSGSGGATKILNATASDTKGNTWTRRLDFIYDAGAANAGVEVGVYTSSVTTTLVSGGSDFVTVGSSAATTAKAATMYSVTPGAGNTIAYVSGAAKCDGCTSGQASGTPQITTDTVAVGEAVICFVGAESTAAVTADADTTNGTWATQQTANSASTMRIASQAKIQTTTNSTQSYDVTITSCDWQTAYIRVQESGPPSPTPTPGPNTNFLPFLSPGLIWLRTFLSKYL